MADKTECSTRNEELITCMDDVVKRLCGMVYRDAVMEAATPFLIAMTEYRKSVEDKKEPSRLSGELIKFMDDTVKKLCEEVKNKLVVDGAAQFVMALAEYRKL